MIRLSIRLLRRHLTLYVGCMVTLGATTVLASAQAALVEGVADPTVLHVPGLTTEEIASQLAAFRGLLSVLSGLAVVISGFLMWSAIRQVVSFRQQELALMRLMGATRSRLARMVFLECFVLGFAIGMPSAMVGASLAGPLFAGLRAIGFFGRNVQVEFSFGLHAALLVALSVALVAGLAGFMAARGATRGDLVSAINPLVIHMPRGEVLWRVTVGLVGFACIGIVNATILGPNLVLAVPLLAVVPLLITSPLLIPAGAWLIGRCIRPIAPGPGMLASQRASKDRVRYARTAAPTIVAVGVLGGFLVANAPDEQLREQMYSSRVAASVVVSVTGVHMADETMHVLESQTDSVARLTSVKRAVSETTRVLYFTDAVSMGRLMNVNVTAGSLAEVTGTNVASSVGGAQVGDDLTMLDGTGRPVVLHVVATLDDPLMEGVFIDWAGTQQLISDTSNLATEIFASSIAQSDATAAIESAGIEANVLDRFGYIQQLSDTRKANTYRSNIGIFGTIYLMSIISLIQLAVSGNLARRREFKVLRSLGVGRAGLLLTVGTEVIIVQLVAGLLVAAVLVLLGLRFASDNGTSAVAGILAVSPATATAYGSVAVVALAAQLVGVGIATSEGPGYPATLGR